MFKWLGVVIVFGLFGLFFWGLFGLHVSEPVGPISPAEAETIARIRVPPEATNIRAASYSQFNAYKQYLRFEAPVDVCLRYAAVVVPGAVPKPTDRDEITGIVGQPRAGTLKDLSWFDLDQAQNVVTAGVQPYSPQVWVDQSRGVFYYIKSD